MIKIPVENAVGMALCHDVTAVRDGFKGAAFQRGHVVTAEDIPELLNLGKRTVFVWEEDAGEIHEEDAARRLAGMTTVADAHYTEPAEGKILLLPDVRGQFRVDTKLLRQINSIGDITIATLPDHYPVEPGARLASMRIVPLVTKETQILEAEALCRGRQLFDLRPYKPKKAGVVITGSEIYTGRIQDKFEQVARAKLSGYPCEVLGAAVCDDSVEQITDAARRFLQEGADLLIFSGGMSVDPDDLTPTAIRQLGADVISHGVPSQPGNMTLLAYLDHVSILGVPSAAISLPTTVFDVLLPQLFTGDRLTKDDLIGLGDGGLCQQCKHCHYPNCTFGRY